MKKQKELEERINQIEIYLKLSKELGKFNSNEINKLNKEIRVLKWVLEIEDNIRKGILQGSSSKDMIIEFLKEKNEPIIRSEIHYNLDIPDGTLGKALRELSEEGTIKREGDLRKFKYSITWDHTKRKDKKWKQNLYQ